MREWFDRLKSTTPGLRSVDIMNPPPTTSLFGLPVSHTAAWIFNAYVIEAEENLVVVDPGLPLVAKQVLELITSTLGRSPDDVAGIACTHGHPDHVGGVSTLTAHCHSPVLLPARCRAYLTGETPRNFPPVESAMRFMAVYGEQPFSARAVKEFGSVGRRVGFGGRETMELDFEPSGFLHDEASLPAAPGWRVIAAPGHTDDSLCLYHEESATLLSGDAVVTQGGTAWFNPEYVDLAQAKETEELLRSLEVEHLLPGHGPPIEASDVWSTAKSSTTKPGGQSLLARCSRRFGRW